MNIDNIKGQFKDYARSNLFLLRFERFGNESTFTEESTDLFTNLKQSIYKKAKSFFEVPSADKTEMINLATKSTSFPSVEMNRPELEWNGFKMPTVGPPTFGAFEATFLIDHDMIIYHYFLNWFNQLSYFESARSPWNISGNNLSASIEIYQLRSDLSVADPFKTILHRAYPISISEIALSEDEAFMEFTVGFYYLNMTNEKIFNEKTGQTVAMSRSDEKTRSLLDRAKGAIGGLF